MTRLSFRCDPELARAVDSVRGGMTRERWLRYVVQCAAETAKAGPRLGVPAAVVDDETHRMSDEELRVKILDRSLNPGCYACGGTGFVVLIDHDGPGLHDEDNCACMDDLCDCDACELRRTQRAARKVRAHGGTTAATEERA